MFVPKCSSVTLHNKTAAAKAVSSAVINKLFKHKDENGSYARHLRFAPVAYEQWSYFYGPFLATKRSYKGYRLTFTHMAHAPFDWD